MLFRRCAIANIPECDSVRSGAIEYWQGDWTWQRASSLRQSTAFTTLVSLREPTQVRPLSTFGWMAKILALPWQVATIYVSNMAIFATFKLKKGNTINTWLESGSILDGTQQQHTQFLAFYLKKTSPSLRFVVTSTRSTISVFFSF